MNKKRNTALIAVFLIFILKFFGFSYDIVTKEYDRGVAEMTVSTNINQSAAVMHNNRNNSSSIKYEVINAAKKEEPQEQDDKQQKNFNKEDVTKVASEMNKFMQQINCDIQFEIHEKTKQLMVQVVDTEGKVLKEFPSHELLDTMAKISEYVGVLLDKKA